MKTTVLGVLTIVVAVANAAISFLKTGTCDFATAAASVTAGIGLIKAKDAPPANGGATQCAPFVLLAALALALLCPSCGTVVTAPDGTRTERKPDKETIGLLAGVGLAIVEIFRPEPKVEPQAAPHITPAK